jgi:hypothetical protein
MFRQKKWLFVRKASALKWLLFFLVVFGSFSLMAAVYAERGFSNKSIQGTWAFSATGTLPYSADGPFALAGLVTFEKAEQCFMTLTINAAGTSWDSTSDTCTFGVNADGTGSLRAEFVSGAVSFPPLSLFFVIVDRKEILAIRTDTVVAAGILRRQAERQ